MVSEPVLLPDGGAQGAVLAVASLVPLSRWARDMSEGGLWEVYVVDTRGHLIAHPDDNRLLAEPDVSNLEIVRQFLETKGVGATVPFSIPAPGGAKKVLGTYIRVPDGSEWGVIVQADEEKAYYSANVMRQQSIGIVGVVAKGLLDASKAGKQWVSTPRRLLASLSKPVERAG